VPRTIVRRYREEPSPLVRDAVRGWRTGRLDRVLGGDFDVIVSAPSGDAVDGPGR
jgi:ATP-dependent Clp protease ATP-binding subunit ClpC